MLAVRVTGNGKFRRAYVHRRATERGAKFAGLIEISVSERVHVYMRAKDLGMKHDV